MSKITGTEIAMYAKAAAILERDGWYIVTAHMADGNDVCTVSALAVSETKGTADFVVDCVTERAAQVRS